MDYKKLMEEKKAQGIRCITNLHQVENLRPWIMKKESKGFWIYSLTFTEKGDCLLSNLMVTPNRQIDTLPPILEDEVVVTAEGFSDVKPYFSYALINVEVEAEKALAVLEAPIYMLQAGKDTKFFQQDTDGKLVDLITSEEVPFESILDEDGEVLENVYMYNNHDIGAMTCTPGQLKQHNITLPAYNLPGFDAEESWNIVTYGADAILCDGSEVAPKTIAQSNTRLAAYKAPSVGIGNVGTFAVFAGKIVYADTEDEYRDGFGFIASEYLGERFSAIDPTRYWFAPWACDGLGVQKRAWSNKILAECVRRRYINEFIRSHGWMKTILIRSEITPFQQEQFELMVSSKGKKGIYAGKIVVIADSIASAGKIDLFTDLNGMKTAYDAARSSLLHMLDMTHSEHDVEHGSNMSTQLVQSLEVIDPQATESIIEKHAKRMIEERRAALLAEEGMALSYGDFEKGDYMRMAGTIAPKFASEIYSPLWQSEVNNSIKGYVTASKKLNLPTKGFYAKITMDAAADFGCRILGPKKGSNAWTIVAPNASEHGITKMIFIKYPKMHHREYLIAEVISPEEYCKLVDESDMTDYQKKLVKEHVMHLSGGMVMLPAYALLKNQLAGMDVDGDAAQGFADEDIYDVMSKHQTVAVVIDEKDVPEEEDLVMKAAA